MPSGKKSDDSATVHVPVMPAEVLAALAPRAGQVIVDGTAGGGGHTRLLAQAVEPMGLVLALDRDPAAAARLGETLADLPVRAVHASYEELPEVLALAGVSQVDGILLDLGLSSDQLADPERGFSFSADGPLDLRFDPESGEPAWRLLQRIRENELADVIYQYGEERYSRRIARAIVERRGERKKNDDALRTSAGLAQLVARVVPRSRDTERIHPATRTFQALRIAVNDELGILERALAKLPDCLRPGGRLAIISFHSLEDRIVKNAFRADERLAIVTKKPLVAREAEIAANPRSRSAKLRVAERK